MPNYKYLIFDVDDTLLDYYHAFLTAQINIAEKLGLSHLKNIQRQMKNAAGKRGKNAVQIKQTKKMFKRIIINIIINM